MKISDHLKKPQKDKQKIQGAVDKALFLKVKEKMKKNNATWDDLLEAMFKVYLAE